MVSVGEEAGSAAAASVGIGPCLMQSARVDPSTSSKQDL
jgi:hypothetical protein